MRFSYVISECMDPYENLAFEQMLLSATDPETAILYLWQNENTIVIGKNQDPYAECHVERFLREGGKIARRRSGGGAVYHDTGNLNYSVICLLEKENECGYVRLITDALAGFGLKAVSGSRNDFLIDGKKFSGNAAYQMGPAVCRHGTLLVDTDIDKMNDLLTPDRKKLDRNQVASVAARVVNLSDVNADIHITNLRQKLIESAGAVPLTKTFPTSEFMNLKEFYADSRWIYSRNRGDIRAVTYGRDFS